MEFKNRELQRDLEKLLGYDGYYYTDITTDFVEGSGFVLDIKDSSYFYESIEDRDFDDRLIMGVLEDKFLF